jgi:hypothetical protein
MSSAMRRAGKGTVKDRAFTATAVIAAFRADWRNGLRAGLLAGLMVLVASASALAILALAGLLPA